MNTEAFERKLRPVYGAIDSRNFKSALKHIDAALKKYPRSQLLRALRAFTLQRCGRDADATALLQAIVTEGPESERVLHTMAFTYKALDRFPEIAPAFAVAAERHPGDLDILVGLFGAYAKELSFVKQQQVALKLVRAHPQMAAKFTWWAVVSLALQARAALTDTEAKIASIDASSASLARAAQLMKLAEGMAARAAAKTGGLPHYEALLLYSDILQGQDKAAEAVEAIKSAASVEGSLPAERRQLLAAALTRAGDLPAAAALYREACVEDPDDWWSWHAYLDCLLPASVDLSDRPRGSTVSRFPVGVVGGLAEFWDARHGTQVWRDAAAAQAPDAAAAVVETATETLRTLQAAAANGGGRGGRRGAALAPLELARRVQGLNLGGASSKGRELAEAITAALPALSPTFSCVVDLRRYVAALNLEDSDTIAWLAGEIPRVCEQGAAAAAGVDNGGDRAAIKALLCRINAPALLQELGLSDGQTAAQTMDRAAALVKLYAESLPLSEKMDPKERGSGEDLVANAAGALVAAFRSQQNPKATGPTKTTAQDPDDASQLLFAAALALEAAQIRRVASAPLRLSACAIYSVLGAPQLAVAQLESLDVKHVLHETIAGHLALPALLGGGAPLQELEKWLAGVKNLHYDQVMDGCDAIFTAYEQETYSKLPEFADFWDSLAKSHTRAAAEAEAAAAQLREAAGSTTHLLEAATKLVAAEKDAETTPAAALCFNDDLGVRPAWLPPACADLRLAISCWWEGSAPNEACVGEGAGAWAWWSAPGASHSQQPAASQWRSALRQALERRRALPHVLKALLQPAALPAERVAALKASVQAAWGDQNSACKSTAVAVAAVNLSRSACSATFIAGLEVHAAASSLRGDAPAVGVACAAVDAARAALCRATVAAAAQFAVIPGSKSCPALPSGSGGALATALLTEDAAWAAACLPTWIKLVGKCPESAERGELSAVLVRFATALHAAISGLDTAILARIDSVHAAAQLMEVMEEKWAAKRLWGYETQFNAENALEKLLQEQVAAAKRLRGAAGRALALLRPWAISM